uniref:hypothetical protein n=1 Tax=uncultured Draconibacterium sp. TaxID=1573823 RepID=UPI00321738D5
MKKLTFFWLGVFLCTVVFSQNLVAQVTKIEDPAVQISIKNQYGDIYTLNSGTANIQITPSGIYKRIITFELDPEDPFLNLSMPYAVVRISLWADTDNDGNNDIKIKDKRVVVTPSGKVKIVHHYNPNK